MSSDKAATLSGAFSARMDDQSGMSGTPSLKDALSTMEYTVMDLKAGQKAATYSAVRC